jgi:DNA-binding transcriptional ArsR family regulator
MQLQGETMIAETCLILLMQIGRKAKPESPEEMALVHHALENPIRRKMIILMNQGVLSVPEIANAVGESMLDYHLNRLELAGLIEVHEGQVVLTEAGVAYGSLVKAQKEMGGADKV